jgi:hypothetical protein
MDPEVAQTPAILYRRCVRTTDVKLLGKIEGQLFGPLRFDDALVLLEGEAMAAIQLLIGLEVAKVTAHEAEKSGFVVGHR